MIEESDPRPDALLMAYIAEGEEASVEPLITRYRTALLTFLRRLLNGAPEAEDLFQETWLRVVRSAHRYDPTYRFSTWLFRIAYNLVRDYWRLNRTSRIELSMDEHLTGDKGPAIPAGFDEKLVDQDRQRLVIDSMQQLPPFLAEVIFLRFFEELSEKEMSMRIGIPQGTVKSRLHRGLRQLAPLLERIKQ